MEAILGQLLAIVIALCWAQNSLIYSYTGKRIGSQTTAHIRLWIAIPIIFATHYLFLGTWFPTGYAPSTYILLASSGVIGFFVADLLIFNSYVVLGPRETLVILTSSPIFTVILSALFLEESITAMQVIGIMVTVIGVMWVIYTEADRDPIKRRHSMKGLFIGFSGAITQAIAVILSKAGMAEGIHPVSANLLRITAGFVGLVLMVLIQGRFMDDFRKVRSIKLVGLITAAVIAGPIIGIGLTLYAITLAPVGVVTAISQISPIILLPIERFAFKKHISLPTIMGTCVAIAGTIILLTV